MTHLIDAVRPGSIADRHGIRAGDELVSVNGEELIDDIDYQALTGKSRVDIVIKHEGAARKIQILKAREAPLGLRCDSLTPRPRACRNKCMFCFIDQMPPGMRETLYVKDDDWRLSLMMGNYITLTNVDDAEFERILRRKASPLYISVHATDPDVRVRMMKNPGAARLMDRLNRLKERGLHFHCQIVLCPGVNDGAVLERTLETLTGLYPAARSAALVPVGLTRYREKLEEITPFDRESALRVIEQAEKWQQRMLAENGTRFVFPSDEMYCLADRSVPSDAEYEGYPQIENGVGLLRRFENALAQAARENTGKARARRVLIACGVSVSKSMHRWMEAYAPDGVQVTVLPVINRFFGETVTVTGLLTGKDILEQVRAQARDCDEVLLCCDTLRSERDLFLDDMPLAELNRALDNKLTMVPNTGDALFDALMG